MSRAMTLAFLIQLLLSGVAVAAMVGLAAWLGIPRVIGAMTEEQVRTILAEDHPGMPIDRVAIAPDGQSAIAVSGKWALTVKRVGDAHVVHIDPHDDRIRRPVGLADDKTAPQTDVAA